MCYPHFEFRLSRPQLKLVIPADRDLDREAWIFFDCLNPEEFVMIFFDELLAWHTALYDTLLAPRACLRDCGFASIAGRD
jgi:hypothetical protein